jgi:hypothetical protein
MGKKKGKSSPVDRLLSGYKFNNPTVQSMYEELFQNMPLEAPVRVEYDDYTPSGKLRGTPLTTRVDPYEQARGEMMVKAKYGYNSGPWCFISL